MPINIWIDVLCFKSISKCFFGKYKKADQVFYINIHKFFIPFIGIASYLLRKPILHINSVVESDNRIGNETLYELIQNQITQSLNSWGDSYDVRSMISKFSARTGMSSKKYNEYLKQTAYFLLFRPIELGVLSKYNGGSKDFFIIKTNPLDGVVVDILGDNNVEFYSDMLFFPSLVVKRDNYYYDRYIAPIYYSSLPISTIKFLLKYLFVLVISVVLSPLSYFRLKKISNKSNIAVELIQKRMVPHDINDIYWLKDSGIQPESVFGFMSGEYDERSIDNIKKSGINLVRVIDYPIIKNLSSVFSNIRMSPVVLIGFQYVKTLKEFFRFLLMSLFGKSKNWLYLQEVIYVIRSLFWKDIYNQLNVSILWSMYDVDSEKLIKYQAIELAGGVFIGSHWSNPAVYRAEHNRCYDYFFTWSKHFIENDLFRYKYANVFCTGYTADYYFDNCKQDALITKKKLLSSNKFAISFYDNIAHNDLMYSMDMLISIYDMLLRILSNYDVILLLKPKKKHTFDKIITNRPILTDLVDIGKVHVFMAENGKHKTRPAEISMISDLVIGLGISTAAAESCFSGTVSFHADLTGFGNNNFSNKGLNQVVFRDIASLESAIISQIKDEGIGLNECKRYHKVLDPFQDGNAYKRTGYVLKQIQDGMSNGLDKFEIERSVLEAYSNRLKKSKYNA